MSNGFYCGGLKAQMLPIAQGNALGNVRRDYTFGIFVPTAQKCHAPRVRNTHVHPQCHGALPLIKQVALFIMSAALGNPSKLDCSRLHDISERDTLINATSFPQGAALG